MHNAARTDALVEELCSSYATVEPQGDAIVQPRCIALQADASNKASIVDMIDRAIAILGRLDVVPSNSGWIRITDFNMDDNLDEDLWDRTYPCNVKAHYWLMHAVRLHLEATKGAFVTTASLAGVKPGDSSLPYAISKAAQIHLVKTLAKVCAPNIRVNNVSPALMLTDWGLQFSEEQRAQAESNRLKRLVTVQVRIYPRLTCSGPSAPSNIKTQDTANVVRMLLLNESMTGQNVVVDCTYKSTPFMVKPSTNICASLGGS